MKLPLSKTDGSEDEMGHYRTGTSASSDRSIMCPVPHAERGDRVSEGTARVATADPVTAVTESQLGAGFAVVARARSTLSIASDGEEATSDNYKARTVSGAIKTTTETDYRAKAYLLAAAMKKLPDSRKQNLNDMVCAVLAPYAPRSSSFYSMRRALVWSIDRKIEAKIKTQDKLQRKKPISDSWLIEIRQLEKLLQQREIVQKVNREELLLATQQTSKRSTSKRKNSVKFPTDWKLRMMNEAKNNKYEYALAITTAVGCRPEEMVNGISLVWSSNQIRVRINGAKVTEYSGHKVRRMVINHDALPEHMVTSLKNNGFMLINVKSKDAFRMYVQRLSKKLFPANATNLSPIDCRHSVADGMKDEGWDRTEIASVLGHLSDATQDEYGHRQSSTRRKLKSSSITKGTAGTSEVVKQKKKPGLAKYGAKKKGAGSSLKS